MFKSARETIKQAWSNFTPSHKMLLWVMGGLLLVLGIWSGLAVPGDGMVQVVGHEVNDEMRSRAMEHLQKQNQEHEIRNGDVYVPRDDADRVRLELVGQGVLSQASIWKFLAEDSIFTNRWDKEKRQKRAVERTLQRMIEAIESVRNASVLLTPAPPGGQVFSHQPKATASVQVELHAGRRISVQNVIAIAGIVAGAVPGLEAADVIIMDTSGNPYKSSDSDDGTWGTRREYERQIERDLETRLKELIVPVPKVVIRVVTDNETHHKTDVKHGQPIVKSQEIRSVHFKQTRAAQGGGIKGGDQVDPPRAGSEEKRSEKETEESVQHVLDKTTTVSKLPAGKIERVTAAVMWPVPADENGEMDADRLKQQPMIEALVLKVLGPQATKEDVSIMPVATRPPQPLPPTPFSEVLEEKFDRHGTMVGLLGVSLIWLFMLYRVFRKAAPAGMVEEIQTIRTRIDEVDRGADSTGAILDEATRMKRGIRDLVTKNPAGAGTVLNDWMGGK